MSLAFSSLLESGLEYNPPSQYLLPVLESDGGETAVDGVSRTACVYADSETRWQVSVYGAGSQVASSWVWTPSLPSTV